ncbi:MAG: hypothetical protein MHMPM18_001284 [Marteilia pararefringens]
MNHSILNITRHDFYLVKGDLQDCWMKDENSSQILFAVYLTILMVILAAIILTDYCMGQDPSRVSITEFNSQQHVNHSIANR